MQEIYRREELENVRCNGWRCSFTGWYLLRRLDRNNCGKGVIQNFSVPPLAAMAAAGSRNEGSLEMDRRLHLEVGLHHLAGGPPGQRHRTGGKHVINPGHGLLERDGKNFIPGKEGTGAV